MTRALVFDLDDTLFPEREFVFSGFRAVDEWLRNEKAIIGFLQEASAEFNAGTRGNIFDVALKRAGGEVDPKLVPEMVHVYRTHNPEIALFADAEWALAYFGARTQIALLTDGYLAVQKRKVEALGITDRFAATVFSDEGGRDAWKPSPTPYSTVMSLLQRHGSECVYIGDNPVKDFVAARALGWHTIHVCRPEAEYFSVKAPPGHQADHVIASLCELQNVLG